jgi:formyltetrahydrofolate hydrolase
MANFSKKFVDPAGSYTGGYTSHTAVSNEQNTSNQTRGVIQVDITSGTVSLQGRVNEDAPWFVIKLYTESALEEIVLAPYLQVVVSDTAEVWIAETL